MFGVCSVSLITGSVLRPQPLRDFFACTVDPPLGGEIGVSVRKLDYPGLITTIQRKTVIDLLSAFHPAWWRNATSDVKRLLAGRVSEEDEAIDIYRLGRRAYYEEENPTKSKELFNKAIAKFQGVGGARHDLGKIAIDEGDLRCAIRLFTDELRCAKAPSKETALLYLYEIYTSIGEVNSARAILNEVSEVKNRIVLSPNAVDKIRVAARAVRGDADKGKAPASVHENPKQQTELPPSRLPLPQRTMFCPKCRTSDLPGGTALANRRWQAGLCPICEGRLVDRAAYFRDRM